MQNELAEKLISVNGYAICLALMEGLAVIIGHDYSFFDQPLVQSGDIVPLELENFMQQPVEFGWLLGDKQQSHLLKEFIDYFEKDITTYRPDSAAAKN